MTIDTEREKALLDYRKKLVEHKEVCIMKIIDEWKEWLNRESYCFFFKFIVYT